MQSAKEAVKHILHKDGHRDTTVEQTVNPAVTHENVKRTQHEESQKVVDSEIHQHHQHTTVQPIVDNQVLPEKHMHQVAAPVHREFHHGDNNRTKERAATEAAQFKNTRTVGDVHHTSAAAPAAGGEHIHHHVHENIQPVIQKETVQPTVVHKTVPVHEVHHNQTVHHTATTLPAVTMAEFQRQGGTTAGREARTEMVPGEPTSGNGILSGRGVAGAKSRTMENQDRGETGGGGVERSGVKDGARPHTSRRGSNSPRSSAEESKESKQQQHPVGTTGQTAPSAKEEPSLIQKIANAI